MNQNYQMVPPVYYQDPMEEKKLFFFRKNCNSVAKALWLNLLLQFALTFLFEFVYIMIRVMPKVMEYLSTTGYASFQEIYGLIDGQMAGDPMFIGGHRGAHIGAVPEGNCNTFSDRDCYCDDVWTEFFGRAVLCAV